MEGILTAVFIQIFLLKTWCDASATPLVTFHVASLARGGIKNRNIYDLCNHPFHVWMCEGNAESGKSLSDSNEFKKRASFLGPISFKPTKLTVTPSVLQTELPSPLTTPKPKEMLAQADSVRPQMVSKQGDDLCSHPFHAWLCERSRKKELTDKRVDQQSSFRTRLHLSSTTTVEPFIAPSIVTDRPETLVTKKKETVISSSDFDSQNVQNFRTTPTTRLGKRLFGSASNPLNSAKENEKYDRCSHPFHSWLCSNPSRRTQPLRNRSRHNSHTTTTHKPLETPSTVTHKPTMIPTTKRKKILTQNYFTTTQRTVDFFTLPSHKLGKTLFSNNKRSRITEAPTRKPKYDKCSHAFHAWMCSNPPRRMQRLRNIPQNSDKSFHPHRTTTIAPFRKPETVTARTKPFSTPRSRTNFSVKMTTIPFPRFGKTFISNHNNPSTTKAPPVKMNKPSEKCSHAFHSWMCYKSASTTPSKLNVSPNQDKPNYSQISISPLYLPPVVTQRPITSKPVTSKTSYNICNHTSRPWMCQKSSTSIKHKPIRSSSVPNQTFQRQKTLINSPRQNNNFPVTMKPKPKEKTKDKCNHAFHSWLCQRSSSSTKQKSKQSSSIPVPYFDNTSNKFPSKNTRNPFTQPTKLNEKPNEKCVYASHSWMCQTHSKTNQKDLDAHNSSSLNAPKTLNTVSKSTNHRDSLPNIKYDKCNHPFHSWQCRTRNNVNRNNIQSSTISPKEHTVIKNPIKSTNIRKSLKTPFEHLNNYPKDHDFCSHPFYAWRCNKKSKSISESVKETSFANSGIRKPIILNTTENPLSRDKSAQPIKFNTMFKKKPSNSWDETDPCSHAFHKWLCESLRPEVTNHFSNTLSKANEQKNAFNNVKESVNPRSSNTYPTTEQTSLKSSSNRKRSSFCGHPFHKFFCSRDRKTEQDANIPQINSRSDSKRDEHPSLNLDNDSANNVEVRPNTNCSHPYHPWICNGRIGSSVVPSISLVSIPSIRSLPLEGEI